MTTTDGGRFRADLIDLAWGLEESYGKNPIAGSDSITAFALNPTQTTVADELWGQWGLVTGGVDLPTPSFQWTPFFGLGVLDRNMMFPVQGRESLEGSIGGVLFCHDSSRLFMQQCLGLAFVGANAINVAGTGACDAQTALKYLPTTTCTWLMAITSTQVEITGTPASGSTDLSSLKPSSGTQPCDYIVIINDVANTRPDVYKDTWAYIGYGGGNDDIRIFRDRDQTQPGWIGPQPPIPTSGSATAQQLSFHSIKAEAYTDTNHFKAINGICAIR